MLVYQPQHVDSVSSAPPLAKELQALHGLLWEPGDPGRDAYARDVLRRAAEASACGPASPEYAAADALMAVAAGPHGALVVRLWCTLVAGAREALRPATRRERPRPFAAFDSGFVGGCANAVVQLRFASALGGRTLQVPMVALAHAPWEALAGSGREARTPLVAGLQALWPHLPAHPMPGFLRVHLEGQLRVAAQHGGLSPRVRAALLTCCSQLRATAERAAWRAFPLPPPAGTEARPTPGELALGLPQRPRSAEPYLEPDAHRRKLRMEPGSQVAPPHPRGFTAHVTFAPEVPTAVGDVDRADPSAAPVTAPARPQTPTPTSTRTPTRTRTATPPLTPPETPPRAPNLPDFGSAASRPASAASSRGTPVTPQAAGRPDATRLQALQATALARRARGASSLPSTPLPSAARKRSVGRPAATAQTAEAAVNDAPGRPSQAPEALPQAHDPVGTLSPAAQKLLALLVDEPASLRRAPSPGPVANGATARSVLPPAPTEPSGPTTPPQTAVELVAAFTALPSQSSERAPTRAGRPGADEGGWELAGGRRRGLRSGQVAFAAPGPTLRPPTPRAPSPPPPRLVEPPPAAGDGAAAFVPRAAAQAADGAESADVPEAASASARAARPLSWTQLTCALAAGALTPRDLSRARASLAPPAFDADELSHWAVAWAEAAVADKTLGGSEARWRRELEEVLQAYVERGGAPAQAVGRAAACFAALPQAGTALGLEVASWLGVAAGHRWVAERAERLVVAALSAELGPAERAHLHWALDTLARHNARARALLADDEVAAAACTSWLDAGVEVECIGGVLAAAATPAPSAVRLWAQACARRASLSEAWLRQLPVEGPLLTAVAEALYARGTQAADASLAATLAAAAHRLDGPKLRDAATREALQTACAALLRTHPEIAAQLPPERSASYALVAQVGEDAPVARAAATRALTQALRGTTGDSVAWAAATEMLARSGDAHGLLDGLLRALADPAPSLAAGAFAQRCLKGLEGAFKAGVATPELDRHLTKRMSALHEAICTLQDARLAARLTAILAAADCWLPTLVARNRTEAAMQLFNQVLLYALNEEGEGPADAKASRDVWPRQVLRRLPGRLHAEVPPATQRDFALKMAAGQQKVLLFFYQGEKSGANSLQRSLRATLQGSARLIRLSYALAARLQTEWVQAQAKKGACAPNEAGAQLAAWQLLESVAMREAIQPWAGTEPCLRAVASSWAGRPPLLAHLEKLLHARFAELVEMPELAADATRVGWVASAMLLVDAAAPQERRAVAERLAGALGVAPVGVTTAALHRASAPFRELALALHHRAYPALLAPDANGPLGDAAQLALFFQHVRYALVCPVGTGEHIVPWRVRALRRAELHPERLRPALRQAALEAFRETLEATSGAAEPLDLALAVLETVETLWAGQALGLLERALLDDYAAQTGAWLRERERADVQRLLGKTLRDQAMGWERAGAGDASVRLRAVCQALCGACAASPDGAFEANRLDNAVRATRAAGWQALFGDGIDDLDATLARLWAPSPPGLPSPAKGLPPAGDPALEVQLAEPALRQALAAKLAACPEATALNAAVRVRLDAFLPSPGR